MIPSNSSTPIIGEWQRSVQHWLQYDFSPTLSRLFFLWLSKMKATSCWWMSKIYNWLTTSDKHCDVDLKGRAEKPFGKSYLFFIFKRSFFVGAIKQVFAIHFCCCVFYSNVHKRRINYYYCVFFEGLTSVCGLW